MELSVWHEVYRILSTDMPGFIYPSFFGYLADHIPNETPRVRRDASRVLSFMETIARCRSFSDGRSDKPGPVEINFADYCVAYALLNEAFTSTYAGAHPMAIEFAKAVVDLHSETKRPVSTDDVKDRLKWKQSVTYKWKKAAIKQKLVQYEKGTSQNNKKPLLPGPARQATSFLPDPQLVFDEWPDIGNEVRFIDPITGEERSFRRARTKPQKKSA